MKPSTATPNASVIQVRIVSRRLNRATQEVWLTATSSRSVPCLLDSWTGAITRIPAYERVGDRVRVRIDLVPGQSTIVALAEPGNGRARAVLPAAGQEVVLHGSLPALRAYTPGVHEVSWSDGRVSKVRVGIQAGMPFGACFWKYTSPATPYGERFIVNGRLRRCGTSTGAIAR